MSVQTKAGERNLDQLDRKILRLLRNNARLANTEVAEQAGLSSTACWNRIKRLEADGYIGGYVALLNQEKLGYSETVLVGVTLEKHSSADVERFGSALAQMPEVLDAFFCTGEYDYVMKVAVASTQDYERFLVNRLYKLTGVRHTMSSFCLRVLKSSHSVEP